jgi:hypothetical protein
VLWLLSIKCSKQGGIMKRKKLGFTEGIKNELLVMREMLSDVTLDDSDSAKITGGCGDHCKVTCSWWCEWSCQQSCMETDKIGGEYHGWCAYRNFPHQNYGPFDPIE